MIIYQTSDSTFQASWAPGPACRTRRAAGRRDRPAGRAGGADRRLRRIRRARPDAGLGRDQLPRRARSSISSCRQPPPGPCYDRLGDYVPWTAVAIAVLAALIGLVRGRSAAAQVRQPGPRGAGGGSSLTPLPADRGLTAGPASGPAHRRQCPQASVTERFIPVTRPVVTRVISGWTALARRYTSRSSPGSQPSPPGLAGFRPAGLASPHPRDWPARPEPATHAPPRARERRPHRRAHPRPAIAGRAARTCRKGT